MLPSRHTPALATMLRVPPLPEPLLFTQTRTPDSLQGTRGVSRPLRISDETRRLHHLLYDPNVGVTTGFWLDDAWGGSWYRTSPSHELLTPTHWMPLPEPPGA